MLDSPSSTLKIGALSTIATRVDYTPQVSRSTWKISYKPRKPPIWRCGPSC